ncbi:MAG: outer membrane beta-barrel protein [Burkholderiales bacterium]|nr:outer membrane beta-barrel protein [Burkholderiales bacterium]
MSNKNILAAALIFAGLAFSANASAQTYVGGTVGKSRWNMDCAGTTSCSTTDTAFKLLGGYDLAPNWALEASYFSLGKATASDGNIKGEFKASGVDFSGVVKTAPENGFVGFAKLGLAYVQGKSTGSVGNMSGSVSKNSAQPVFGLGFLYQVSNNVNVRAEYESRKVKVADIDDATSTVRNFSVGVQASF